MCNAACAPVCGNITIELLGKRKKKKKRRRGDWISRMPSEALLIALSFLWIRRNATQDPPNYSTLSYNKQIWFSRRLRFERFFKIKRVKIVLNELFSVCVCVCGGGGVTLYQWLCGNRVKVVFSRSVPSVERLSKTYMTLSHISCWYLWLSDF